MADLAPVPPVTRHHPDAAVILALRRAGVQEITLPDGAPSLWLVPGSDQAVTWREILMWLGDVVSAQRRAHLIVPYWRTSEFWLSAATFLAAAGMGLTALMDVDGIHPAVAAVAGVFGAVIPVAYQLVRTRAKQLAAQEMAARALPGKDATP